jgi:tetratricopeptide (TPR) repeat protein
MERSLLIATLVVLVSVSFQAFGSGIIQDRKPHGDYIDRAAPPVPMEARKEMDARLAEARVRYERNPNDPDAIIWLGRRLAYPGRFRESIEVYSEGIKKFPRDARFYRHRGHRYITLRRFDLAIADLKKAADLIKGQPDEVEPDGQPNARNIPTSTLQFNIWYHLGLAHYLRGDNRNALDSYRACLKVSNNADARAATSHWLYMTLRRMKRDEEAAGVLQTVAEGWDIIENQGYYRLLLMYKGMILPETLLEEASRQEDSPGAHSILYGVGNWYLYNGRRDDALKVFSRILAGNQWTSFGYVAAEAEMTRQRANK